MRTRPIDPRDTEIQIDFPTYRVYFWERQNPHPDSGYISYEYEIDEVADVHEVVRWAEANSGVRTFTLYIVVDKTLIRLAGDDPTVPA
ncbi:MAG: hypothetical protein ACRDKT_13375 [Actinomycetota bacterium]